MTVRRRMQREFPRQLAVLPAVFELVEEFAATAAIDAPTRRLVALVVEELFSNALRHNADGQGNVRVRLDRREDVLRVSVTDFDADRFDPRDLPPPDLEAPISERAPGGLGFHLIRQLTDGIEYEYEDRVSTTTVTRILGKGMFQIEVREDGTIAVKGRLDASQIDAAAPVLDAVQDDTVIDLSDLDYISSAGIGLLMRTQRRLRADGGTLRLSRTRRHVHRLFRISGLLELFDES